MSTCLFGYQGGSGFLDVLTVQGSNPLANWKVAGPKNVQKQYDKAVKGYILTNSGGGCKLQIPKDDKVLLGLVHPYLVLQISLQQGQPFTVELIMSEASGTRRRIILSSSFSEAKVTPLHCQLPFLAVARDTWLNVTLPLAELCGLLFKGVAFKSLDSLTISGTCKLRRVFTLRDPPYETAAQLDSSMSPEPLPLPRGLEFPPGVDVFTQVLDGRSLLSLGIQLPPSGPAAGERRQQQQQQGAQARSKGGPAAAAAAAGVSGSASASDDGAWAVASGKVPPEMVSGTAGARGAAASGASPWHPNATDGMVRGLRAKAGAAAAAPSGGAPPGLGLQLPQPAFGGPGATKRPATDSAVAGSTALTATGRRAVSAQTAARAPDGQMEALPRPGVAYTGNGGAAGKPKSPPRAKPGQRMAAGAAGSDATSLQQQPGEGSPTGMANGSSGGSPDAAAAGQQGPASGSGQQPSTPASPASGMRYGRRAIAGPGPNIPTTITEGEPLRSSAVPGGAGQQQQPPAPAAAAAAAPQLVKSPSGKSPSRAGRLSVQVPRVVSTPQPPSPGPPTATGAGTLDGLSSVLQVRAGVDASLDFSARVKGGAGEGGLPLAAGGSPFIASMVNIMQSVNVSRDRYAKTGGADEAPSSPSTSGGTAAPTPAAAPAAAAAAGGGAGRHQVSSSSHQRPNQAHGELPSRGRMQPSPSPTPGDHAMGLGPGRPLVGGAATGAGAGAQQPSTPGKANAKAGAHPGAAYGRPINSPAKPGSRQGVSAVAVVRNPSPGRAGSPGRLGVRAPVQTPSKEATARNPSREGAGGSAAAAGAAAAAPTRRPPAPAGAAAAGTARRGLVPGRGAGAPAPTANLLPMTSARGPTVAPSFNPSNPNHHMQRRASKASTTNSINDIDESLALNGWDGFGIDEEDELGARHLRLETIADDTERSASPMQLPRGASPLPHTSSALPAQHTYSSPLGTPTQVMRTGHPHALVGAALLTPGQQQGMFHAASNMIGAAPVPLTSTRLAPVRTQIPPSPPAAAGMLAAGLGTDGYGAGSGWGAPSSPPAKRMLGLGQEGSPAGSGGSPPSGGGAAAGPPLGISSYHHSHFHRGSVEMDAHVLQGDALEEHGQYQHQQAPAVVGLGGYVQPLQPPRPSSPPHIPDHMPSASVAAGYQQHFSNAAAQNTFDQYQQQQHQQQQQQQYLSTWQHHGAAAAGGPAAGSTPIDVLLEDDLLMGGRPHQHHTGGAGQAGLGASVDDWANVERLMPAMDLAAHQRLYTPPVVVPSKMAAAAAAAGARADPQVLSVHEGGSGGKKAGGAGGQLKSVREEGGEEMVDLVYDPILNAYYDAKSNQYFELKH